jgi:hypothetical protein
VGKKENLKNKSRNLDRWTRKGLEGLLTMKLPSIWLGLGKTTSKYFNDEIILL